MNESKNNPNAQAKAEGKKTGFAEEIKDIAIITKLATIGLEGLKSMSESEKGEYKEVIDAMIELGPYVIAKFEDTGRFLYEKANASNPKDA